MDINVLCTICGSLDARRCAQCRSAAYCSVECQQTDWRTHRLLCKKFKEASADGFAVRPSPKHYLAIYFPISKTKPRLVWVNSKADEYEQEEYLHPDLDQLLHIPGNQGYVGRGLHCVRGNRLRGRTENADAVNIWHLDPDVPIANLTTNQTVHGTIPTLIGDAWGETIFKGPMVVVVKEGNASDPRRIRDVTLTAYRDAIDFLGYYIETQGSMIDGLGAETTLAQRVIAEDRAGKATGWRINCRHDRVVLGLGDMSPAAVPRAHPVFGLEGDDPLDIPSVLGFEWVVKVYNHSGKDQAGLENEMARLLLLRATVSDGKWEGVRGWLNDPTVPSGRRNPLNYSLFVRAPQNVPRTAHLSMLD